MSLEQYYNNFINLLIASLDAGEELIDKADIELKKHEEYPYLDVEKYKETMYNLNNLYNSLILKLNKLNNKKTLKKQIVDKSFENNIINFPIDGKTDDIWVDLNNDISEIFKTEMDD